MKKQTSPETSLRIVVVATASMLLSCGIGEVTEEEGASSREASFLHGTPPGPAPWSYMLTSYDDYGTPACGGKKVDGKWYYATGAYTFGCGARLRLEANGKCVVVAVVDNGPAAWVEAKSRHQCGGTGFIIDASPLASKALFGTLSAGWSDCYAIQVTEVAEGTPTGPVSCSVDLGASSGPAPLPEPGFIGDPCTDAESCSTGLCLTEAEGFPQGTCSKPCAGLCPDKAGYATTFCAAVAGEGRCLSSCDYDQHPLTGCREGYRCVRASRFNNSGVERDVCML